MTRARFIRADGTSFFDEIDVPWWPRWSRMEPTWDPIVICDDPDAPVFPSLTRVVHYERRYTYVPCGPIACQDPAYPQMEVVYVEVGNVQASRGQEK